MKIHLICCLPFLMMFFIFLSIVTSVTTSRAQNRYPDYFPELNKFFSTKPLGANFASGNTVFRLFAPNATS
ncbi:MAG TPA: hypothetical protein VGD14_21040, partial [bacterium]